MYSYSLIVLACAVFGASAQAFVGTGCGAVTGLGCGVNGLGYGLNGVGYGVSGLGYGVNGLGLGCGAAANCGPVGTAVATTPVTENLPIRIPGVVQPTAVQDTCSCVKTVVRPTMRKEIINIPSVQRFVQTTTTPVVETIPYVKSCASDIPCNVNGVVGSGIVGAGYNGVVGTGLVGAGYNGLVGTGYNGIVGAGYNGIVGTGLVGAGCNGVVGTGLVGAGCAC